MLKRQWSGFSYLTLSVACNRRDFFSSSCRDTIIADTSTSEKSPGLNEGGQKCFGLDQSGHVLIHFEALVDGSR